MRVAYGLLPVATGGLLLFALRPAGNAPGAVRLAMVRASLVVAGAAVALVEALSLVHGLTPPVLVAAWSVATVLAVGAAGRRYLRDGGRVVADLGRQIVTGWRALGRLERLVAAALLVLLLAELVVAVLWPPNNFDSQTYHLPKIEHWVVDRDVRFYPTAIDRQVAVAPGAEYLLLHLRLLTGGDALDNLLQYGAGLGCVLLASRIAGQLGGSRRAQLLSGFAVATAPMVALESTSTQTDLVTAAWVGCVATLVLDELRRRTAALDLVLIGAAVGLAGLTKLTGLLAAGPLLLVWAAAQVRLAVGEPAAPRALTRVAVGGALIVACAGVLAGPYLSRSYAEFGSPLGPADLRATIAMQRHDPGSVLVNALRIGYTALDTPVAPLDGAAARAIVGLSHAIGVDPEDPATTFVRATFPTVNWAPNEDTASLPVAGVLVLVGAAVLLVRPHRLVPDQAVPARVYAAVFWTGALLYAATIKWQPWGNRLILFLVVLGAPMAGLWLDAVLRGRWPVRGRAGRHGPAGVRAGRSVVAALAAVSLAATACAGWLSVGYGWPRRLVGSHTVYTMTDLQARFQRRPQWLADYQWAAAAVRASGAHRVGLVEAADSWEYPWWVLLPGRDIVAMQSVLPGLAPARPDEVGAVLCEDVAMSTCARYAPTGWTVRERNATGYALPPGSATSLASSGG